MTSPRTDGRARPGWALIASAVVLGSTIVVRALDSVPIQDPPKGGGEDEAAQVGEEATTKICTECHEFDQVVAIRRSPREWKDMVTTMANKGANASPAEFALVRSYLTRYYGTVAVNTAPAADLSAVLGLPAKDAEAVVAYRMAHGKFADLAALLKVPGLERDKLDEQAEALRFD